jgi:ABC-type branched-subunit amino acid transport system ATPase component/ABC-type branched-subunit amino acid transport system permease subunit
VVAGRRGLALIFLAALAAAPAVLSGYWTFVLTLAVIYALLGLSLVVVTGWSGQLNLHVAALGFGWGSYAAFALVTYGVPPTWALVLAGLLTIPFAAVVAIVAVRFRGLELAIATLAIGLIFERLVFRNLGESLARSAPGVTTPFASSFVSMPRPSIGGAEFSGDAPFFYFCLVLAALVFAVVWKLGRGGTGRNLRALREREVLAETLGMPVVRYRIGAFVGSIVIAGVAGALFASFKQGIAPDSYNLDLSFQILAATVIGGIYSPAGAVIGGGLMALLPEVVRTGPLQIFGGERLFLVFGIGMILVLWRLPAGIAGWKGGRWSAAGETAAEDSIEESSLATVAPASSSNGHADGIVRRLYHAPTDRHAGGPLLRVDDLRVGFGGVVALDGASLFVPEGEICALIGPNGAGKSTLFNCVSGLVTPDRGRVYLHGRDVTEVSAHRRAAFGVGRTFQTVEVFRELSVRENLVAAGYLSHGGERIVTARADAVLSELGLVKVADRLPGDLPLGSLRIVQIGMALVARPRLLLLDEPSAGLDELQTAALAALISRTREEYGFGVLLVEHDMTMVASLAEHVYVLDFGSVIAQGTPEQVRRDPLVLEKYLGIDWAEPETVPRRRRAAR